MILYPEKFQDPQKKNTWGQTVESSDESEEESEEESEYEAPPSPPKKWVETYLLIIILHSMYKQIRLFTGVFFMQVLFTFAFLPFFLFFLR